MIHISPVAHCISRGRCECKDWLVLVAISKKYVFNYLVGGKIEKAVSLLWDQKSVEFIMDPRSWDPVHFAFWDQLWEDPVKLFHYCGNQLCCARRAAVGSCFHPWHSAALCCHSENCVHNFCQPFEEAFIGQGWGPALLGDGEDKASWEPYPVLPEVLAAAATRWPNPCLCQVMCSSVCVMCGPSVCTAGKRETSDSVSQMTWRFSFLVGSTFLRKNIHYN